MLGAQVIKFAIASLYKSGYLPKLDLELMCHYFFSVPVVQSIDSLTVIKLMSLIVDVQKILKV